MKLKDYLFSSIFTIYNKVFLGGNCKINTKNLKYLTVKIEIETDDGAWSVGTGFYIRPGDIPMTAAANHVISEKNIKLKLRYKIIPRG